MGSNLSNTDIVLYPIMKEGNNDFARKWVMKSGIACMTVMNGCIGYEQANNWRQEKDSSTE